MVRRVTISLVSLLLLWLSSGVNAEEATPENSANGSYWKVIVAPFALHWTHNKEHKYVYLLGIEYNQPGAPSWSLADETVWGVGGFSNSFGQPSAYVYYGYRWNNLFGHPAFSFNLTGGLLYGYRDPYEDKVPFNYNGFSPGVIPSVSYRLTRNDSVQLGVLGTAGLIFMYDRRF